MEYITLSPRYSIRNEAHASFLIEVSQMMYYKMSFGAFCVPTFIGYILAHIGDFTYDQSLRAISANLGISIDSLSNFVNQLIENEDSKEFKLDDSMSIIFPPKLLVKTDVFIQANVHESGEIDFEASYESLRPSMPVNVNLMVTTDCSTDCKYCYANRKIGPKMDVEKLFSVIDELHSGGTVNLTLTGGDIFAMKDWRKVLAHVRKYGYNPYISTKTPLGLDDIEYLMDLGYKEIQFSLDSTDTSVLMALIGRGADYYNKVKEFFTHCSKLGMNVLIRTVLTSLNSDIKQIHELYNLLQSHDCVKEWALTPAFFSQYKEQYYKDLEVPTENLKKVYEFSKSDNLQFPIILNKINKDGYVLKKTSTVEEYVCTNQICTANTYGMSILANGKCSVCEMLYDNPEYILGDLKVDSIKDVWNSEKALALYDPCQKEIDGDSPCHACMVFDKCKKGPLKRACYLDISKTGKTRSYPDPRCPLAGEYDMIF